MFNADRWTEHPFRDDAQWMENPPHPEEMDDPLFELLTDDPAAAGLPRPEATPGARISITELPPELHAHLDRLDLDWESREERRLEQLKVDILEFARLVGQTVFALFPAINDWGWKQTFLYHPYLETTTTGVDAVIIINGEELFLDEHPLQQAAFFIQEALQALEWDQHLCPAFGECTITVTPDAVTYGPRYQGTVVPPTPYGGLLAQ